MMWGSRPVAAEAFFGSFARGDRDTLSDLDYLIVDDDYVALSSRKAWLADRGFSVSDFTWTRLKGLFKKQTLFSIHLQQEAKIVCDTHNRLAQLLMSAEPKLSYAADYQRSLELLRPLENIPDDPRARAWAMDVLTVAYRNSAILKLACDGEYVFSGKKIVAALQRRGLIDSIEANSLNELRKAKSLYRFSRTPRIDQRMLDRSLSAVSAALHCDFDCRLGPIKQGQPVYDSVTAYASMRRIEGRLVTVPRRRLLDPTITQRRSLLLGKLKDPHAYLWSFLHGAGQVDAQIRDFEALL